MGRTNRSDRIIRFIENLTIPSGIGVGEPFLLREWQRKFIRDVYDPHNDDGSRTVRRAVLSVARKNGKSALLGGLVCAHLFGPEWEPNGEIYSAANEREQAALIFKYVVQLLEAEPGLIEAAGLTVIKSTKTIVCKPNGSFFRSISAEAGTKHGLNPTLIIYDELAQAKKRDLYDVLDTSQGARKSPLFVSISTQNPDGDHILSQLIDDGLRSDDPTSITHLYAVPDDCEDVFDESVWHLANPALGDFRSLTDMRAMADKAQRLPSFETSFRNLYLNQRIDAASPLIPRAEWLACAGEPRQLRDGESVYLGLDLSTVADLSALVAVSADDGDRVCAWFWKPGDLVKEHAARDRAPYDKWERDGWLEAPSGRTVRYEFIADRIAQVCAQYDVVGMAFDRWRIEYLLPFLTDAGLVPTVDKDEVRRGAWARGGLLYMVPWGQGWKDMAPAIDALETAILERTFVHDSNPLLALCFANAQAITDPSGNRKLDKAATRMRIDGAVACAMALGLKSRLGDQRMNVDEFISEPLSL